MAHTSYTRLWYAAFATDWRRRMLLLVPLLMAIVAAMVKGGSLRHLAALPVRGGGLLVASFAVQLLLYLPAVRQDTFIVHWAGAIYIGALALALAGALRNWHLGVAARIATLGLALNATVIALNGGHMPVNAAAMRAVQGEAKVREIGDQRLYGNTWLAGPSSRLTALSDVIPVVLPGRRGNVYSVGDVLLAAGVAALAYQAARRPAVSQSTRR
jgi:hypothetical protein